MKTFFITGTDTDVGKTFITRLLLAKVKQTGQTALAIKPISAGSDDAVFLQKESSLQLKDEIINPIYLQQPLSPHIAAKLEHKHLQAEDIYQACKSALQNPVDYLFVEGAGGWLVPINDKETMADLAVKLQMPVIIVVAMRLGCLNHSLLTVDNILSRQLNIAGFIANQTQATPQTALNDNIATLQQRIPAPLLGVVPYSINKEPASLIEHITLP
ncbi:MAG: dethiobiotin synthase [Gammaproteobacteria bacterium]|jgi:dethiobiotin synthetase